MVYLNEKGDPFSLYVKCMRIPGAWPMESHKHYTAIIFWATTSLQFVLLVIPLIHLLQTCPADEFESNDVSLILWQSYCVALQLSCQLSCSRKMSLIESTIHDWSSVTDPEEREIMIEHNKRGSLIFTLLAALIIISTINDFIEVTFIAVPKTINIRVSCAFAYNSTWAMVHSSLAFIVNNMTSMILWSTRALFWTFFMHLSSQYKILKVRYDNFQLIEDNKERRRVFRRLVRRHNELLVRSRDLKTSVNYCCTMFIFFDQLWICVSSVWLVADIKVLDVFDGAMSLMWIMVQLLCLYVSYYAGDYLTACCEDVGEAFTQCNWYDLPKEFIINYSIAISRCRRPTQFSVMKIYKLNLHNFKYVIEALYSYITLLLAVTKDTK